MRHVFIADAHLRAPADPNYQKMLQFLGTLPGTTHTLFILGDLFEFWIGHRSYVYPHYLPVLDRLRELRRHGTRIVYFEGNHDFHLGPVFEHDVGAEVFPGPAVMALEGKNVYLCHGDEINRCDYGYRVLRYVFHCRLTAFLARIAPPALPSFIADRLGHSSRKRHPHRQARWDYSAMAREFAARRFAEGCDVVITGHFHQPFLHVSDDQPGHVLISLGDWISHFSYAELVDGELSLRYFTS